MTLLFKRQNNDYYDNNKLRSFLMSESALSLFVAKLKADASLRERLRACTDLDAALLIAAQAGFDLEKADLLLLQQPKSADLADRDLEVIAGGYDRGDTEKTIDVWGQCKPRDTGEGGKNDITCASWEWSW